MKQPGRFSGADLLLIAIAVVWGFNVVVVKTSLAELGPLPFNSLRFLLAAAISWLLLWITGYKLLPSKEDIPRLILLGFLGHTVYQVLFISGINLTSAGNTALLLATIPVWVAALAGLTGAERTGFLTWAGIGLSVTGIVLVTTGGGQSLGGGTWFGDIMLVCGTFFYAFYTIKSRTLLSKYAPLQFTTWTMTAGALALLLVSLKPLAAQDWSRVGFSGWGGLAYSAGLAIALGYYGWSNGVKKLGASRTAIYNNLTPITAMITGMLFLDERITLLQASGAVFIIGGLSIARRAGVSRSLRAKAS